MIKSYEEILLSIFPLKIGLCTESMVGKLMDSNQNCIKMITLLHNYLDSEKSENEIGLKDFFSDLKQISKLHILEGTNDSTVHGGFFRVY